MRSRIPLALVLLAFVAVSCDQQPVAPVIDETAAELPTFNWMNNPDGGSFRIFRSGEHFAACWSDEKNGLRACHATIPLGGGAEPDCGLQADAEVIAYQEVLIKEDAWEEFDRIMTHYMGDVYITVRDTNSPGDCFNAELVAEGWGVINRVDNDAFGTTEPNTNAWGANAHGVLMTVGGEEVQYSGHFRSNFRFYPEPVFKALSNKVDLK